MIADNKIYHSALFSGSCSLWHGFWNLMFEIWDLFGIWYLEFGIELIFGAWNLAFQKIRERLQMILNPLRQ